MPLMCRRHRILATLCAAFALVYSQLVFSGYSCAMVGMGGSEMESPTLCQLHCDYDQQEADAAKPAPQPLHAAPLVVRLGPVEAAPASARLAHPHHATPGPAPPLARFTVLRI
jgi:hypothetical protein